MRVCSMPLAPKAGLVQQSVYIVAARDPDLFVRPRSEGLAMQS